AIELGARWGTWGLRGVALLRQRNPMPYQLVLVESLRVHCAGAHMVLKLNDMEATLKCTMADADLFLDMMAGLQHLDLLHIDIQGAEVQLLSDPRVQAVLTRKVYRIILGTHSE
ncbi:PPEF2, partial [Symbiodinium microadriaticum]